MLQIVKMACHRLYHSVNGGFFIGGKGAEDEVVNLSFMHGPPNAQTYPQIIRAKEAVQIPKAIMAPMAAADFDSNLPQRQVQIIMKYNDMFNYFLVKR